MLKESYLKLGTGADAFPPNNVTDGLFGKLKIIKLPSIAIIDNSDLMVSVIQYNDLFDDQLDGVSAYARDVLKKSLEQK